MVIHEKFVQVHMVKTAGTFLQDYFGAAIPGTRGTGLSFKRHRTLESVKDLPNFDSIFKFGVMRNPFAWYVSWWYFHLGHKSPGNSLPDICVGNIRKRGVTKDEELDSFRSTLFNIGAAKTPMKERSAPLWVPFDVCHKFDIGIQTLKFMEKLCKWEELSKQEKFDGFKGEHFLANTTVSMERLRTDLPKLFEDFIFPMDQNQIDILDTMPKKNTKDHKPYAYYYEPETIEWVKHKERYLFEIYDYVFEQEEERQERFVMLKEL